MNIVVLGVAKIQLTLYKPESLPFNKALLFSIRLNFQTHHHSQNNPGIHVCKIKLKILKSILSTCSVQLCDNKKCCGVLDIEGLNNTVHEEQQHFQNNRSLMLLYTALYIFVVSLQQFITRLLDDLEN